ncbi:glutamate 5-kinase [Pseudomonas sp. ArH3a]|uniref:glutamate 5-kinase n=1 Tax=Pseudomonas sp. ArH3a TaxID=2862945 RepID=UPI001F56F249|nr:glutamate 5-kinase [Pseudomonas sp. ArH3a]UNM17274.1 glutamate 5-kinase [Pseudomonas sp. ArH3a]
MGMRDEIQAELAEAFDDDLADAVSQIVGSYTGPGVFDPVTEEDTAETITYTGRGVITGFKVERIDGINIKVGDAKCVILSNEIGAVPDVGHAISAGTENYLVHLVAPDPTGATYQLHLRRA